MTTLDAIVEKLHEPSLPKGWRTVALGDVCEINPSRPADLSRADDEPTSFVPMDAVDAISGTISKPLLRQFGGIKKGYTCFAEGDVLFAKITPCMQNGKHAIARGLTDGIGFGTTEFHVLRPTDSVLAEWIHFFVRQPEFLLKATEHFTGAVGQQRLPPGYLQDYPIPLPPLPEQKRIVATLREQMAAVEKARAAAQARLEAAKALPAAYLRHVFEADLAATWQRLPIALLGDRLRGDAVQTGPFGAQLPSSEFRCEGVPVLNIGNVKEGRIILDRLDHVSPFKANQLERYRVRRGDMLFTRSGSVGRSAVVPEECDGWLISYHLLRVAFDLNRVEPGFISAAIRGDRQVLNQIRLAAGRGATRDGVNASILAALRVPCPSIEEQRSVLRDLDNCLDHADRVATAIMHELDSIDAIPAALLRQVFNGEM